MTAKIKRTTRLYGNKLFSPAGTMGYSIEMGFWGNPIQRAFQ